MHNYNTQRANVNRKNGILRCFSIFAVSCAASKKALIRALCTAKRTYTDPEHDAVTQAVTPHLDRNLGAGSAADGGDGGIRTLDLCVANAALSRLSYAPVADNFITLQSIFQ